MKKWVSDIQLGGLKWAKPVLDRWCRLMQDPRWGVRDAPWWYNERASLSQLAGAIWLSGGWAFEEFVTTKQFGRRQKYGRGDLMIHIGSNKFIAEAKQYRVRLNKNANMTNNMINSALSRARKDITHHKIKGHRRLAIVFLTPTFISSSLHVSEERIRIFIQHLQNIRGAAVAWVFLKNTRFPRGEISHWYYPGVGIIIKPMRRCL